MTKNLSARKLKISIREYMRLGVPSAMMTYFDYWIYTILLFLSTYMGSVSAAAQVILFNVTSAVYAVGLGFGQATCTLVGNNVGKGKIVNAKRYIALAMLLMQSFNVIFSSIFFIAPDLAINLYTSDIPTVEAARLPLRLIAIGHLVDSVQLLFQGVIRGVGLQSRAFWANSLNYVVGLPLSLCFGFGLDTQSPLSGLFGLWLGFYIA